MFTRTIAERAIGLLMRIYRRSPLYPRWGRFFARVLSLIPRHRGLIPKTIRGVTFELDLGNVIDASLYYSGTFEADTERAIEAALGPGMTAIDIGANFGYHTFRMASAVGPTGSVLAIEPMSQAYGRLLRNAALNDFSWITFERAAATDCDQGLAPVTFQSSYRLDSIGDSAVEVVRLVTLDSLVAEHELDCIDFIKLDVDGFEGKVLRGSEATLRKHQPVVLFEISPGRMSEVGDAAEDLVQLLQDCGYELCHETGELVADLDQLLSRTGEYSVNLLARPAAPG